MRNHPASVADKQLPEDPFDKIAEAVVNRLKKEGAVIPFYCTAEETAAIFRVKHSRNIPKDLHRHYPNGRRSRPLFRRDQIISYIEGKPASRD